MKSTPITLTLLKTANVSSFTSAGQNIIYTYTVTNTSSVPIGPIVVTDNRLGSTTLNLTLAQNASTSTTLTYVVTQQDVDNGVPIVNVATASSRGSTSNTSTVSVVYLPD